MITAAVPVWCWPELEREVVGPDATKVVSSHRAILPKGTDVREADRLSNIVMRDGRSVVAGSLSIEAVVSHRDHVALSLRQIGGQGG